jgi:hypothetical protein
MNFDEFKKRVPKIFPDYELDDNLLKHIFVSKYVLDAFSVEQITKRF